MEGKAEWLESSLATSNALPRLFAARRWGGMVRRSRLQEQRLRLLAPRARLPKTAALSQSHRELPCLS